MINTTAAINKVLVYMESRSAIAKAVDLWPSVSIKDQRIWADRFKRGLAYAWRQMDLETRRRFTVLAMGWK